MSYANPELLWTVEELQRHLDAPRVAIMDLRPPEAYSNGHIPGARSFDIFGISLIDTRPQALDAYLWVIEHLIQAKGINADSTVVIYDDIAGNRAARLFWFLEFFGHKDVHVLNGGFNAWTAAGLPTTRDAVVVAEPGNFKKIIEWDRVATGADVLERLHAPGTVILDTRSEEEWTGQLVRSARGGRIPSAVHLEWLQNLNAQGFYKPGDELRQMYAALGVVPEKEIVPYCQGGYRAANTYLALRLIGFPKVRNYLGSWGEWGNRTEFPIDTAPVT